MILALLVGCTRGDPIDRLTASLGETKFPNGFWKPINLSPTAEQAKLALMALESRDGTNFTVLSIRTVRIVAKGMEGIADPDYTAILGRTDHGQKIALLQLKRNGTWVSRVYDAKLPSNHGLHWTAR